MENNETNNGGDNSTPSGTSTEDRTPGSGEGLQESSGGSQVQSDVGFGDDGGRQVAQAEAQANISSSLSEDQRRELVEKYVADSVAENIIAFNAFEIKKKTPKAYDSLLKWMNETSHIGGQIDDEVAAGVLLYSPRTVTFNFFDKQDIIVNIIGLQKDNWSYVLELGSGSLVNNKDVKLKSRTEAEIAAFEKAFEVLENKLKK